MKLADRYRRLGPQRFARWVVIKRIGKPIVRSIDRFTASQSLVNQQRWERRDGAAFERPPAAVEALL